MLQLLVALLTLSAALPTIQAAPPPLSVQWWFTNQTLYRTNEGATCEPYPYVLYGRYPPFDVKLIRSPFDPTSLEAQEVLVDISSGAQPGNFSWIPSVEAGTELVLRVVDAEDNIDYSAVRSVEEGYAEAFRCRQSKKSHDDDAAWQRRETLGLALGLGLGLSSILWGPVLYSLLRWLYRTLKRTAWTPGRAKLRDIKARRQRQKEEDVEATPAAGLAETGAFLPIPLKAVRTHGAAAGQPVERGIGFSRTSSRAPSYTSTLLPVYEGDDGARR